MPHSVMIYVKVLFYYQVESLHGKKCCVTTAFRNGITKAAYTEADREVGNIILKKPGLLMDSTMM